MFRKLSIFVAALLFSSLVAYQASAADITVKGAWAPMLMDTSKPGAIFLMVNNAGDDDSLVDIKTPAAEIAQMHNSKLKKKKMRMRRMAKFNIPKGMTKFAHGGTHVMLMKLAKPLKMGDTFPLTLVFEKAGSIDVTVTVKKGGGDH